MFSKNLDLFKFFAPCPFGMTTQLRPTNGSAGFAGERRSGTPRHPRRRRRERRRRRRRNPTGLYSPHVHESICLYLLRPALLTQIRSLALQLALAFALPLSIWPPLPRPHLRLPSSIL